MEVLTYGGAPVAYALHPAETVRTLASVIMLFELSRNFSSFSEMMQLETHHSRQTMGCQNAVTK